MATKTVVTKDRSISFNKEELEKLEKVAKSTDQTVSQIVRKLVRGFLREYTT